MAEGTEPLEILSVGIEADVRRLLEGAREGVDRVTRELEQIPPVELKVDPGETLENLAEVRKDVANTVDVLYTLTEQMLHARPAAVFATSMRQMGEDVKVTFNDIEANAQSMLNLLMLGVPEGGVIKITVDSQDAVQSIGRIEQALVSAELITQEATHSLEELGALPLGPQLAGWEGRAQELAEALDQVSISSEMWAEYGERQVPFLEETSESLRMLISYAETFGVSLGTAATQLHETGEIGVSSLEKVLVKLQQVATHSFEELGTQSAQAVGETVEVFYTLTEQMLHAFPAFAFAESMREMGEEAKVVFEGSVADAQNALDLIALAVPKDRTIKIQVETEDAAASLETIREALVGAKLITQEATHSFVELKDNLDQIGETEAPESLRRAAFSFYSTSKDLLQTTEEAARGVGELGTQLEELKEYEDLSFMERQAFDLAALESVKLKVGETVTAYYELDKAVVGGQVAERFGELAEEMELVGKIIHGEVVVGLQQMQELTKELPMETGQVIGIRIEEGQTLDVLDRIQTALVLLGIAAYDAQFSAAEFVEGSLTAKLKETEAPLAEVVDGVDRTITAFYQLEAMIHERPAELLQYLVEPFAELGSKFNLIVNGIEYDVSRLSELEWGEAAAPLAGMPMAGDIIEIVASGKQAVAGMLELQSAMLQSIVVTKEQTFSVEELLQSPVGPKMVEWAGGIEGVAQRLDQLGATEMPFWEHLKHMEPQFRELFGGLETWTENFNISLGTAAIRLHELGLVGVGTLNHLVEGLQQVATTHINPSPLRESIDNIIERLGILRQQVQGFVGDLQTARTTRVGEAEFLTRLGIDLPETETRLDRLKKAFTNLGDQARQSLTTTIQGLLGLKTSTSQAAAETELLNKIIQTGASQNATALQELAGFVARIAQQNEMATSEVIRGLRDRNLITRDSMEDLTELFEKAGGAAWGFNKVLSFLGTTASQVFGYVMGAVGIKTLSDIAKKLWAAVPAAIAFQGAIVRLEIAVRAAQRHMGMSVGTIEEWKKIIGEAREEFRNLSEVQLTKGAAAVTLLTRELSLNQQQMEQVYRSAATLASIHGIDVDRAITLVVHGLTGIGRGLRRYGVFLSRAQLNAEAFEMGLNRTWTELTAHERALVSLNVIQRQTEPLTEDLAASFSSMAGAVQTLDSRMEDAEKNMGTLFTPAMVGLKAIGVKLAETLGKAAVVVAQLATTAVASFAGLFEFFDALLEGVGFTEAFSRAQERANEVLWKTATTFALVGSGLEDVVGGELDLVDDVDEAFQQLLEIAQKFGDQFEDALQAYHRAVDEAGIKLVEDLEDLESELERDRVEAFEKYLESLDDLATKYADKRADILKKAADALQKLEDDQEAKRRKLVEDYHIKMQRMEEDHQITMRRLREKFVEDMRGAIAKRDAWAAVQLIRNFARDRKKAKEDYGLKRRRAGEDHTRKMKELDDDLEERREKIRRDLERELRDLEIWLERRKAEEKEDYDERLDELRTENERKEDELRRSHDQKLEDLETHFERKLEKIARAMADEEAITAEGARAVFEALFKVFGIGGDIDRLMDSFEARMARKIEIRVAVERALSGGIPQHWPEGFAKGGSVIARKPTLALFGEVPELATFTPLSSLNRVSQQVNQLGILRIEVRADEHFTQDFEDLVAMQISDFVGSVVEVGRRVH